MGGRNPQSWKDYVQLHLNALLAFQKLVLSISQTHNCKGTFGFIVIVTRFTSRCEIWLAS